MVSVALCCALLLAEAVVRMAGLGTVTLTRGRLHRYDAYVGWVGAPDLDTHYTQPRSFDAHVESNSLGHRSPEVPLDKPAGTRRLVVLGDSFLWGYGVDNDQMVSNRLAQRLTQGLGGPVDVINLAANGYSTVQECVRLEREGLAYQPDVVVLGFTSNDLDDNLDDKDGGRPIARVNASGDGNGDGDVEILNSPVRQAWKSPTKQWFRHNSRLFVLAEAAGQRFKFWRAARKRTAKKKPERDDEFTRASALSASNATPAAVPAQRDRPRPRPQSEDGDRVPLTQLDVFGAPFPEIDYAWKVLAGLLERARDTAADGNARLLVVYNASRVVTTGRPLEQAAREYPDHSSIPTLDPERPRRRLAAICAELGVDFVDLTPAFKAQAKPGELFLPFNGHWSVAGNELVAESLEPVVRALLENK